MIKDNFVQMSENRSNPLNVNRLMELVTNDFRNYTEELQRDGVRLVIIYSIFSGIINYVLRNESNYTGSIEERTDELLNDLREDNRVFYTILRGFRIPDNRINQIFRDIINFVLRNIRDGGTEEETSSGWSSWEDLGGTLTSAPGVASWGENRLDVLVRGENRSLWHKWWDGNRWSDWEDLGGTLVASPAAVSWGPNRIDVFGVGTNQSLWHKWWDGSRWSEWEDLGGVLTSPPSAVSWGPNRIDVFARGRNQSLWQKYWDGSRWSSWGDVGGGTITSGPAAASTGRNRLDIFARDDENELIYRTWNGSRWSEWDDLDGVLTSEPAAVSWGGNRLDVFARGQNNHLWHIWRP